MVIFFPGNINQTLMALRSCFEMLRDNQKTGGNKVNMYIISTITLTVGLASTVRSVARQFVV